jgi:MYXO-CTERM domain-containing protein
VSGGCDARGAADQANFLRQQAKIVAAINALDAQVISLEEIENSAVFGKDRDTALATLVSALNADLGQDTWAFVPSPAVLPANEDVIRTAFIYQKAAVETVGGSTILTGSAAFSNARQPLAQAFQLVGDSGSTFLAIVNHFKSKGSGTGVDADMGDGQGASNASRVNQATALVAFADTMSTSTGIDRVFLTGDFNAYDQEDPIKVITDAGYLNQEAKSGEYTYAFGGSVGSLDHVFASPEADAVVSDVDVWNINSVESVALEYSRYNNNVTDFYVADPFRSSDHDPAILGLNLASPTEPTPVPTPVPTTEPTPVPTTTPTVPAATAPSVAPTAAPESALTAALRDTISTNASRYAAGSAITITVPSQHAGEFVSAWVRSTPVDLGGWLQVSTEGTVTTALPKDLTAGTHRIIVQDAAGAVIGWTEITIVAPGTAATGTLASTGVDTSPALVGALLLLMLGALLMRRRRAAGSGA